MDKLELINERIFTCDTYTIGHLYQMKDGEKVYVCDVLEDTDRNLFDSMNVNEISSKKKYGITAIPCGTYVVRMDIISPKYEQVSWAKTRYQGKMPRLQGVKGYSGILMHPGTTAADTYGCLLLGKNTVKGKVLESRATFFDVMDKILIPAHKDGKTITITIVQKYKK